LNATGMSSTTMNGDGVASGNASGRTPSRFN